MKTKYYAVRKGRTPGVYGTWDECKAQTNGFAGAEYKSFKTKDEAESWMAGDTPAPFVPEAPYAFTDGSYNKAKSLAGYGGFLVMPDGTKSVLQGSCPCPPDHMANVMGELMGAVAAVKEAMEAGLTELNIYYDYEGIGAWPDGTYKKANTPETRAYLQSMLQAKQRIRLNFVKVAAHTGIPGNEEADRLAKQAAGVI